jgi:hypothetical protein
MIQYQYNRRGKRKLGWYYDTDFDEILAKRINFAKDSNQDGNSLREWIVNDSCSQFADGLNDCKTWRI